MPDEFQQVDHSYAYISVLSIIALFYPLHPPVLMSTSRTPLVSGARSNPWDQLSTVCLHSIA